MINLPQYMTVPLPHYISMDRGLKAGYTRLLGTSCDFI